MLTETKDCAQAKSLNHLSNSLKISLFDIEVAGSYTSCVNFVMVLSMKGSGMHEKNINLEYSMDLFVTYLENKIARMPCMRPHSLADSKRSETDVHVFIATSSPRYSFSVLASFTIHFFPRV